MDISTFFKNGDPSQPFLNANGEGAFKKDFKGSFADEKMMNACGCGFGEKNMQIEEEEKLGMTRDEILDTVRTNPKDVVPRDPNADILDALSRQDGKISTGTWIAIGVVGLVIFGGLGYILYKKYK